MKRSTLLPFYVFVAYLFDVDTVVEVHVISPPTHIWNIVTEHTLPLPMLQALRLEAHLVDAYLGTPGCDNQM